MSSPSPLPSPPPPPFPLFQHHHPGFDDPPGVHQLDYPSPNLKTSTTDLNSKIMLTAIVSLSFVIILVIALHIYARCILRRQARRRAALRRLGLTMVHVHSSEPPKTGLDPTVIESLPKFAFKQMVGQDEDDDGDAMEIECAVCLSMLENGEMARLLPNCKHTFHAECIDKWLNSQSTCPICRTEAEPRFQPEPREVPAGPVAAGGGAPPFGRVNSSLLCMEGTSSDGAAQSSSKASGSISRLSSFRKILTRERSSRRIQSCGDEDGIEDLERQ